MMKTNKIITFFTPHTFLEYLKGKQVYQGVRQTPAGALAFKATDDGIFEAVFLDAVSETSGSEMSTQKLLLVGTPFQQKVWQAALQIPAGTTLSYHDLAHKIGKPSAFRAVANALGANKISYFVPCHRIKRKNGDLGGYAWGIERKKALLAFEAKHTL